MQEESRLQKQQTMLKKRNPMTSAMMEAGWLDAGVSSQ